MPNKDLDADAPSAAFSQINPGNFIGLFILPFAAVKLQVQKPPLRAFLPNKQVTGVWGSFWVHFLDPHPSKLNQTARCKGRDLLSILSKGPAKAHGSGHQSAYHSLTGYLLAEQEMRNSEPRGQAYLHHLCHPWDSARKCFPEKPHYFLLPSLSIKPHERSWRLSICPPISANQAVTCGFV